MRENTKRQIADANEWISEHEPGWQERRCLARAIVESGPDGSVTHGSFSVQRSDEHFIIEGPRSILILPSGTAESELDKIMAAIGWVDAIEERINLMPESSPPT